MLRSGIEQTRSFGIFADRMHIVARRNAINNLCPGRTVIVGPVNIRRTVIRLIILCRDIRRARLAR